MVRSEDDFRTQNMMVMVIQGYSDSIVPMLLIIGIRDQPNRFELSVKIWLMLLFLVIRYSRISFQQDPAHQKVLFCIIAYNGNVAYTTQSSESHFVREKKSILESASF